MTVHIEGVTLVSDTQLDTMRRIADGALVAMLAGEISAAANNLTLLEGYILAIKRGVNTPKVEITYGRASLRDIRQIPGPEEAGS